MMHFVRTVSITVSVLKATKHIVTKRFEIMEKFYSSKALLEMAGGGMHTQRTQHAPLDLPLVV